MSFWSRQTLRDRAAREDWLVEPFREERLAHSAYELALGNEVFVTSFRGAAKKALRDGQQVPIPPGEFAILITEERIAVPEDAIAFISIKYSVKSRGLVNVSGFHVDPGFRGRLKFAVYNSGPQTVSLECGRPLFLIWFASMDRPTDRPYLAAPEFDHLSPEDIMRLQGSVESTPAVSKRLNRLRTELRIAEGTVGLLFAGVLVAIVLKLIMP